jgi:hypothetical protein
MLLTFTGTADAQVQKDYFVLDFGAAYTQATVVNAKRGFIGLDIFAGKMLTNNLCLGFSSGYDVVSFEKVGESTERLAMIPLLVKAKYYFNVAPMMQFWCSLGVGAYRSVPHLIDEPIGGIWFSGNHYGGSLGIGFDYWFLLTQGVGIAYEYHFCSTEPGDIFSYFALRVDYCMFRF